MSPYAGRLTVVHLARTDYRDSWRAMQRFSDRRGTESADELWCLEHPAVYTQGSGCSAVPVPNRSRVPVIASDRGGQITYHGPGQLIVYALVDLRRRRWGPRRLVSGLEDAVISMLAGSGIRAYARPSAPGVYVDGAKVAALGLRIRSGSSLHGLGLNVDMDLSPFDDIDPCGYPGLRVTQLRDLGLHWTLAEARERLVAALVRGLGYCEVETHARTIAECV